MRSFLRAIQVLVSPTPLLVGFLRDQRRWIILAPPDPLDQIIEVLERELGQPVGEIFDEFEREPATAASPCRSAAGAALGGPTGRPLLARRKGLPDIRDSGRVFRG